jgi:hypothetical protein
VVPAVSVVLGWEVEGVGVGGSGGVECEALGVGYRDYDFMFAFLVRMYRSVNGKHREQR